MVPAPRVLELLAGHGLGEGETEAIAACEALGYMLCSDDKPARDLGVSLLGAPRVLGSIRLLRWCVEEKLVECTAAFSMFAVMKQSGGFLPKMEQSFFCAGEDC
jgi:predicted nucleic acid-binding protein